METDTERYKVQPPEVVQEWVSYPDAEKYCGLSHTTLWRYVKCGDIRAAKVGRSVRIHLPSLREFMESRAAEAALRQPKQGNPT